jgi:hypothetical protein
MTILNHGTGRVNPSPCPCEDCQADVSAAALAARFGLADDDPDPAAIEADARAAEAIRWGQWSPVYKRPVDADYLGDLARAWEPRDDDREWWATENVEGCGEDELSPEEQENELYGESEWIAACKEHARWMEEQEQEAAYHEMIGRLSLGGFPASDV